jgi:hypothetical protein
MRLLLARQLARRPPPGALVQAPQAFFDEALAGALDRGEGRLESRNDLLVGRAVGSQQQDARAGDLARRVLTAAHELAQLFALIG